MTIKTQKNPGDGESKRCMKMEEEEREGTQNNHYLRHQFFKGKSHEEEGKWKMVRQIFIWHQALPNIRHGHGQYQEAKECPSLEIFKGRPLLVELKSILPEDRRWTRWPSEGAAHTGLHRAGADLIDSVFRAFWDWPILFILFLLLWTEEAALLCAKGQCEKAIPVW